MSTRLPFLYGSMKFDFGTKPVIIKQGNKYCTAYGMDGIMIMAWRVTYPDKKKFFIEYASSVDNLKLVKKVARFMYNRSALTGLKRDMTRKTRIVFKEILR